MSQNQPDPGVPRKLSEAELEKMVFRLMERGVEDMAKSVETTAELLAMRAAILKLAELTGQDRSEFSQWMDEVKKHFHHELLSALEEKDAWMASMLDKREPDDL